MIRRRKEKEWNDEVVDFLYGEFLYAAVSFEKNTREEKIKRHAERVEKYTPGIACQVGVYVGENN